MTPQTPPPKEAEKAAEHDCPNSQPQPIEKCVICEEEEWRSKNPAPSVAEEEEFPVMSGKKIGTIVGTFVPLEKPNASEFPNSSGRAPVAEGDEEIAQAYANIKHDRQDHEQKPDVWYRTRKSVLFGIAQGRRLEREKIRLDEDLLLTLQGQNDAYKYLAEVKEKEVSALQEQVKQLTEALEELRDACCTAVNWGLVIEAKVGDAPWISQGDANEVEIAVLKANAVLSAVEKIKK